MTNRERLNSLDNRNFSIEVLREWNNIMRVVPTGRVDCFEYWLNETAKQTLTQKEVEFVKYALLLGYNYMCRDEECYITLYEKKPVRLPSDTRMSIRGQWCFENNCDSGNFTVIEDDSFDLFVWLKWESGILNLATLEITDEIANINSEESDHSDNRKDKINHVEDVLMKIGIPIKTNENEYRPFNEVMSDLVKTFNQVRKNIFLNDSMTDERKEREFFIYKSHILKSICGVQYYSELM